MDLSDASHDTNAISLLMAEEKDESNAGKNSHINFQMPHPLDANTKAVVPYQGVYNNGSADSDYYQDNHPSFFRDNMCGSLSGSLIR